MKKIKCEQCKKNYANYNVCVYTAMYELYVAGIDDKDTQFDMPEPEYQIMLCKKCNTLKNQLGRSVYCERNLV